MVNLSQFFPRLLPYVVGCPEPLAQQALLDSAIEFCHRSLVVTAMLDPVTIVAGTSTYELDLPAQTAVEQVLDVWRDGTRIEPSPYETTTNLYRTPATPQYYYGQDIDEVFNLSLLPSPDTTIANGLRVRVALRPTRSATKVHDILYDRFAEGIVAGALGILMTVADEPFTNPTAAAAQTVKARMLANNARFDAMHGRVQSSLSVRMRAF